MMKKNKFILSAATGLLLVGLAGVKASAEDEVTPVNGVNETDTTVTIEDKNIDPGNPDVPGKGELVLKAVPTNFNFKTALKDGAYSITASKDAIEDNKITVFNNYSKREWEVNAYVKNSKLKRDKINDEFDVTVFKIDNVAIGLGTGNDGKVHSNETIPETIDETNVNNFVGELTKNIDSIEIGFNDADNKLKVDDKLTGEIHYTVRVTPVE